MRKVAPRPQHARPVSPKECNGAQVWGGEYADQRSAVPVSCVSDCLVSCSAVQTDVLLQLYMFEIRRVVAATAAAATSSAAVIHRRDR